VDGIDVDIPSLPEAFIFQTALRKTVWLVLQPFFYAIRPLFVNPKPFGFWETVNTVACVLFDLAVLQFLGWRALIYLVAGTFLGLGLHPAAGHFVAEHYVLTDGQETYSYYGICNWLNFNVGYHNEHHDFPKVPWSKLPLVRKMAPEFYTLPHYTSYLYVFYRYIFDRRISPFSRIKRRSTAETD